MIRRAVVCSLCLMAVFLWLRLNAAPLNISQSPLFINESIPPLSMIVLSRDHKLYYEAYNDASDVNGDGNIDTDFVESIVYYGYFDPFKCYSYNGANSRFDPISITSTKMCSGAWSGNFLNYLTTARIDALRKVLYGGYRGYDYTDLTVLERSHIPQDAHSWGKEYTSPLVNGYDIRNYTPLSLPSNGNRILFANTTLLGTSTPLLRVATVPYRVWEWLSIERPVAGDRVLHGSNGPSIASAIQDYSVRVKVCDPSIGLESNCQLYPNGHYKPIGLLHEFGEIGAMKFGLLTGSYGKNLSGGVVRKNISDINDEIDPSTGQLTNTIGIIKTIDRLKTTGFGGNYEYNQNCGWITTRNIRNGECRMWGNPIAEMMYEALRHFAGKSGASSAFDYSGGDDTTLGLPKPAWVDPYQNNPWCALPNLLVISDIYPSSDSDEVPGNYFSSFSGDLNPSLNASSLGQTIYQQEFGGAQPFFIGQSGGLNDGAPTVKTVNSFGNIRGLVPEEPNKEGSYNAASVAYYGWLNDISGVEGKQQVHTYVVALSSPFPEIKIPVGNGLITLVPFAKSVDGCFSVDGTQGTFQPTNTIVDFYVETLTPSSGRFRINFEDVQQGADHDMDAIAFYEYVVNPDNTVTITIVSSYAAGCIEQHLGYVISGTTQDGVYLEVRDLDTAETSDIDYFLDTPPGALPGLAWQDNLPLPVTATRTFSPSATGGARLLPNPLWYAAKWGSFKDQNNNNKPDINKEFDVDNDGTPDNYFLVHNALKLADKLRQAFNSIINRTGSISAASLNSDFLSVNTRIYQALFNTQNWQGQLLSFAIDVNSGDILTNGPGPKGSLWDAGSILNTLNFNTHRKIITYKPSTGKGIAFRWPSSPSSPSAQELDAAQSLSLNINPQTGNNDNLGASRLNFIRGDMSQEEKNGGSFRNRNTPLGDIIHSDPHFVGIPSYPYPLTWPDGSPENNVPYASFKTTHKNRTAVVYVGANDGMLHAFNATTGRELFAYIPSFVFSKLNQLTSTDYSHRYYVDGPPNSADVFYASAWHTILVSGLNAGGQGIFALDITDPSTVAENTAQTKVLWEFSDANDVDMGYSFSQPAIVRMANGQWAAVFGNGYNNTKNDGRVSTTGNAVLYIVNISDGSIIKKFDTEKGTNEDPNNNGQPNGMSTPIVVDANGDYIADYIYAGDLFGNLWKIDVTSANTSQWSFSYKQGNTPKPFFIATDPSGKRQPITARPIAARDPARLDSFQIYIGTGKYIEASDKTDLSVQSVYGLFDSQTTAISGRNQLVGQFILSQTANVRIISDNTISDSDRGWVLDLVYNNNPQGERVVSDLIFRNDRLIFTTLIPSEDPCSFGGSGWLMEISAESGARLNFSVFDINNDGTFNSLDFITINDNGNEVSASVSGVKSSVGLLASPAILTDGKKEHKYMPGTSGNIQHVLENPGNSIFGRQSWRQLK